MLTLISVIFVEQPQVTALDSSQDKRFKQLNVKIKVQLILLRIRILKNIYTNFRCF